MSRFTLSRAARRLTVAAAAATTAVLLTAVPAAAHVEVESANAQALAENVEITFVAESESATAGITQLRVVLPKGITPADVVYGKGPAGWKFTADAEGYVVKGPAVKVGENAEHSIVVRQLPDAKELAFKTLQTYSDGKVDRWIELGESGGDGHGHGNEAPVLKLKAAAPGAKPATSSPSPSASPSAAATPAAEETAAVSSSPQAATTEKEDEDGGLSAGAWTGIVAAVLVAGAAVVLLVRRRGSAQE
ncbi:DUF1775 domain-containing protein [Streptomyces aurantiogriseus]|uniref:YncI copper-binding domain-containing protein n=1 Tax=Streptomyces aurantiogriseus TaxID=66870 RepID=A0A918FJH2_9ACTN|nr:DUF1775 domain-containing protein [Streptomyces aurantiogriseus]GGR42326.1 hypothetical protein GCM10010251_69180 [Streptomyces aurantiogriseus]